MRNVYLFLLLFFFFVRLEDCFYIWNNTIEFNRWPHPITHPILLYFSNYATFVNTSVGLSCCGEDLSWYDEPLNLRGSFVDLVYLGVPHQFLDWVFGVEAVSSEHLHRISGCLVSDFRSMTLGHWCHNCILLSCQRDSTIKSKIKVLIYRLMTNLLYSTCEFWENVKTNKQ